MNSEVPKQFLLLQDKPILVHTINQFIDFQYPTTIIVVLPNENFDYWEKYIGDYLTKFNEIIFVKGGETRTESVHNGVSEIKKLVTKRGLVSIHDGVRPFVSQALILNSFQQAIEYKAVVAAVATKNSLRQIIPNGSVVLDRTKIVEVQTPQVFDFDLLYKTYQNIPNQEFTDDGSLVEGNGTPIHLIEGEYTNIKITTAEDLAFAEVLFQKNCLE